MLHNVNKDSEAVKFWTEKMDFSVISEENTEQGMRWIEIAPSSNAETTIVLHDKEVVEKMSPGLNLGTPSLLFYSNQLEAYRLKLLDKGIVVGDIMTMPTGRVFNFADQEENYFAVMESE